MQVGAALRRFTAGSIMTIASISAAGGAPSAASAGFACATTPNYEVRTGDSWYGIADMISVGVDELVGANDASPDSFLAPGDRLCVPVGADLLGACPETVTVRPGDSWGAIAARASTSAAAVAAANGAGLSAVIHPGDAVCLPAGATVRPGDSEPAGTATSDRSGSYTVAAGDSWSAIAFRAGVRMTDLLAVNDATASEVIVPGDRLRLPDGSRTPTAATTSVRLAAAPTQGPCGFADTWGVARGAGRRHAGTDIFPGDGNHVYAVVDGRLTGRLWDGAGRNAGNAWTLTGSDGSRYFYGHLSDFAPDLRVGSTVRAGQIIGWVGSTGNASAPHLHVEIRPGGNGPVNPFPLLQATGGCNTGRPYTQPGGWVPERRI